MDRRAFLKRGLNKTAEVALSGADAQATRRAARWIRPPYALSELEFLLACTRCGDCVDACPHGVIFPLSTRLGAQVAATPAMDLLNRSCHLCETWPCVTACEPGALARSEAGAEGPAVEGESPPETPLPRLAIAQIDTQHCLPYKGPECGACLGSCPVPGALNWQAEKPRIDPRTCTGCALCREACIVEPKAVTIRSILAAGKSQQAL